MKIKGIGGEILEAFQGSNTSQKMFTFVEHISIYRKYGDRKCRINHHQKYIAKNTEVVEFGLLFGLVGVQEIGKVA